MTIDPRREAVAKTKGQEIVDAWTKAVRDGTETDPNMLVHSIDAAIDASPSREPSPTKTFSIGSPYVGDTPEQRAADRESRKAVEAMQWTTDQLQGADAAPAPQSAKVEDEADKAKDAGYSMLDAAFDPFGPPRPPAPQSAKTEDEAWVEIAAQSVDSKVASILLNAPRDLPFDIKKMYCDLVRIAVHAADLGGDPGERIDKWAEHARRDANVIKEQTARIAELEARLAAKDASKKPVVHIDDWWIEAISWDAEGRAVLAGAVRDDPNFGAALGCRTSAIERIETRDRIYIVGKVSAALQPKWSDGE